MNDFVNRIVRAARLDIGLYEEVEADRGALGQAMIVVVLASIAAGVGTIQKTGFGGIVVGTIVALVGWYVWAYLTYFIGAKIIPEPQTRADHKELLRTIGFASSPGLVRVLGIIPGLTGVVFFIAAVWMLVAMVVAVRQALDYKSTLRAVAVCLVGWVVQAVFILLLLSLFGVPSSITG